MNCPKCSSAVADGSAYCPTCGTETRDPAAATVAISVAQMEDPLLIKVREALAGFYAVEKELGRGGMAVVYKGKEKGLEREVAIKVLPPEMALAGGTADRFRREARLAASLEHQNIIPVYRVGEEQGLIYMAMKFVRGRPLDAIIEQQGALPVPVVVRILHAAASGLAHAHDHNVVHRDIKGANILIELDGRPLVSDFGIARAMTENSLTASGMVIGTPNFMSPEQCGGSKVGPQSDQYSLGILGFQMLTGQLPFEADSIMGIIQHHYMTPPPDIRQVRDDVPPELMEVIARALAKKPDERFATTHDMAEALENIPLTPEQKRESLTTLKQLSAGEGVAKVRTGTLPPISVTAAISGQRPSQGHPGLISGAKTEVIGRKGPSRPKATIAQEKKSTTGLIVAVAAVLALVGGGGAYWKLVLNKPVDAGIAQPASGNGQPAGANAQPAAQPAAPPPAPAATNQPVRPAPVRPQSTRPQAAPSPAPAPPSAPIVAPPATPAGNGTIIVRVSNCLQAVISIDGREVARGSFTGQLSAGSHSIRVTAEGAAPFQSTVDVVAGQTHRVPVSSITCGSE